MGDTSRYHCAACGVRPRANLTEYEGKLWRPECLAARSGELALKEGDAHAPADPGPLNATSGRVVKLRLGRRRSRAKL